MKSEVIFEHPSLTLSYYPEGKCILETWRGYTSIDLFKELLDKILNFMITKSAPNLILDTRLHKGLNPDGQKYAAETVATHAKKYGQLRHAIVVPADIFSKFSVDSFSQKLDTTSPVINRYFKEVEDALEWMTQENP